MGHVCGGVGGVKEIIFWVKEQALKESTDLTGAMGIGIINVFISLC